MRKELLISQIKQIQLNILLKVADFCKENNINYFLTAGTLIGALRHKGFIPWDDDIDIVMLRDDYNKFISIFNKVSEEKNIKVFSPNDKNYPYTYAKVSDTRTMLIENKYLSKIFELGINIDVFPLDYLTDDFNSSLKFLKKIYKYNSILELKQISLDKKRSFYKQLSIIVIQFVLKIFSYKWLINKINVLAQKNINNEGSKYIGQIVIKAKGEKEILERSWFAKAVDVTFEKNLFKAPIGYDAYMKRLFGNYMQLPPKEKQITHHYYKAYYIGE